MADSEKLFQLQTDQVVFVRIEPSLAAHDDQDEQEDIREEKERIRIPSFLEPVVDVQSFVLDEAELVEGPVDVLDRLSSGANVELELVDVKAQREGDQLEAEAENDVGQSQERREEVVVDRDDVLPLKDVQKLDRLPHR